MLESIAQWFRDQVPPKREAPPLSRYQTLLTGVYAYSFGYMGFLMSSVGPALLTLGAHTDSSVSQMGYAFMARSVGYVGGSSFAGPLFDRMNGHRLILIALTFAAIATFCIPFITSLPLLAFIIAFQGIAMGTMDVGGNVMLLWLHPTFADPYLQMIHFCFGAGSTIAPLILSAFMESHGQSITLPFVVFALLVVPALAGIALIPAPANPQLEKQAAEAAAAANNAAATDTTGAGTGTIADMSAVNTTATADTAGDTATPELFVASAAAGGSGGGCWHKVKWWVSRSSMCVGLSAGDRSVIALLSTYLGLYVGAEVAMGGLIYSYTVTRGIADTIEAAHLNATFWGLFAVGRLLAIPLSTRLPPQLMLYGNAFGCLTATILVLCAPDSHTIVWLGVSMYGFFMASCFPSAFSLADQYVEVTGRVGTWFVIGSAIGEMALPIVTASLFDVSSTWLWVIELIAAIAGLLLIAALSVFGVKRPKHHPPATDASTAETAAVDLSGVVSGSGALNDSTLESGIANGSTAPGSPPLRFQPLRDRYDSTDMASNAGFTSASPGNDFESVPVARTPPPQSVTDVRELRSDSGDDLDAHASPMSRSPDADVNEADADADAEAAGSARS